MSSVFGNARVIWTQDDAPNTWAAFRKTFPVNDLPGQAQLHVAADNKYWLYINGQRIVCEGGLNRESMPGCGYYDTVDIAPYLKKGQNLLAVLAWYWGNSGRNNSDSGLPGLLFSCDELNLYSDASVSAKTHTGFCATQPPHPAYLYGGHNIGFRAENDMEGWQNEEFCACRWSAAIEKDAAKWGELYPRPIPMHRFSEPRPYVKTEYKGNQVIAHLPYAIHAIPLFTLRAPAGKLVDVRTDHYETPGGPGDNQHLYRGHRVEYITKDGLQSFECLNWMFGEKVIYTLEEGVELVDISYRESGYNCDLAGAFSCIDNMLSRLMEKCRRTLYVCMRDNYMDCPDRERGQWIGDVSAQLPQTFYCLSREADMLSRKAIHDFIHLRKGHVLVGNVPGENFSELPSQSLNAISDMGMIMEYARFSGDISVLDESYEASKQYLLLWDMGEDGFVLPRKGNWYWFDHLDNIDGKVLENCWYVMAVKALLFTAMRHGYTEDIALFEARLASIRAHFEDAFWRGDGYRTLDIPDDRANAMAVLSGLYDPAHRDVLLKVFREQEFSTPYMEYYVLEALCHLDAPQDAVDRMRRRYSAMASNENSTLWEDFAILGTTNHAWSGGPSTICCKYLAGMYPAGFGMEHMNILPLKTDISNLSAQMPTSLGKLSVQVCYHADSARLSVSVPCGMKATIGLPESACIGKSLYLNEAACAVQCLQGHLCVTVDSGEYELIAR